MSNVEAPEGPAPLGRGVFLHYISINGWPLRGWKPPTYFLFVPCKPGDVCRSTGATIGGLIIFST